MLTESVSNDSLLRLPDTPNVDTYAVNAMNQYTSITPQGQSAASVVHDDNGNVTTDHRGQTYTYDAENVLRSASGLAAGTAAYQYYADGTRRQKTYDSATSTFYYTGDQEVAEYDGSTLLRAYVRLPGSVDEPLLMIDYTLNGACINSSYADCEVWAHQNRLGSIIATTDGSGAVIETYAYSAYGESDDDTGFPFRFTGQKLDPETGLYFYKARYYDPETGRFNQTDPIGYQDHMNLYAYVGNDPVNKYDPSGLCEKKKKQGLELDVGICGTDARSRMFLRRLKRDKRTGFAELDKEAAENDELIKVTLSDDEASIANVPYSLAWLTITEVTIFTGDVNLVTKNDNGSFEERAASLGGKLFHELGHVFTRIRGINNSSGNIVGGSSGESLAEAAAVNFENDYYRRTRAGYIRACYKNCDAMARRLPGYSGYKIITNVGGEEYVDYGTRKK